jgi:hypothetical protein
MGNHDPLQAGFFIFRQARDKFKTKFVFSLPKLFEKLAAHLEKLLAISMKTACS